MDEQQRNRQRNDFGDRYRIMNPDACSWEVNDAYMKSLQKVGRGEIKSVYDDLASAQRRISIFRRKRNLRPVAITRSRNACRYRRHVLGPKRKRSVCSGKAKELQAFDRKEARFKSTEVEIDSADAPEASNVVRMTVGDEEQAKLRAEGRKSEAEREAGEGSVELDITPEAQAEAQFSLTGARPGVDGTYRIVTVTHKANRTGGATTRLELKQPGRGAGKDNRPETN